jgi:DNA polymerase III epsilon subunit-like protein
MARPICAAEELLGSFSSSEEAFFWLGAATYDELLDRESHVAKTRPALRMDLRPPCNGRGKPAYLVFDVETDGGSPKQLAIQLAFVVFDAQHRDLFRFDKLFKLPEGKQVSYFSQKIHKISLSTLRLRGVEPRHGLVTFFEWVDFVKANNGHIVAHNAAFDSACLTHTASENALPRELRKEECFCTMQAAKPFCGLKNKKGAPKPPSNAKLYEILHGNPPDARLHAAGEDVRVTAASYRRGREVGWW